MFSYIKQYFDMGLYTKEDIKTFVQAAMITSDEFKTITGQDYPAQRPAV